MSSKAASESTESEMTSNAAKMAAAVTAVKMFINQPANMRVGLGSGSTVVFVAEELNKYKSAIQSCVPTSYQSRNLILSNDLPLKSLDENENSSLHVTIDGADEIAL